MARRLPAGVALVLLVVCIGCGGGGGGGGGTPPPWEGFTTGSATWNGMVGPSGRVPFDILLQTGNDVSFFVARGTLLRTVMGTRVFGPVQIGIDDAGGPAALMTNPDLEGVVRPYVLQGGALVDARFDPPAKVMLEIAKWATPGGWQVFTNVAASRRVLGPPPTNLAGPGNAGNPFFLGCVSTDEFAREVVSVPQVGPLGFHFEPLAPGAFQPKPVFSVMSTRDIPLPGATADVWPKVYAWKLVNPGTADIVAIGTIDAGMTNGQSQTVTYSGNTYTAAVVSDGMGGRKLEITTNVSNKFSYELDTCDSSGTHTQSYGDASGGSSDEGDTGGTYAGVIEITVTGWGGYREAMSVEDDIEGAVDSGDEVYQNWFDKPSGGDRWFARFSVHGHSGSTQDLAGSLPAGWTVTPGDRTITVVIPCPAETVAASDPTATTLTTLDPTTFGPIDPELLGAAVLDFAILPNGEVAAASTTGMLHIVDLPTAGPSTTSVPVPGLTGAVALSPFDDLAYVATDTGRFEAYDLDTAALTWFVDTLPMEPYSSMCVAGDGAFAYVTAPGSEHVVEIDLVHHEVGRTFAVPGSDQASISQWGDRLSVVDVAGGGIRIVDFDRDSISDVIVTHTTPRESVWTQFDEHIAVAGDLSVAVVNPEEQGVVGEFVFPDPPLSLTTRFDGVDHTIEVLAVLPSGVSPMPGVVRMLLEEAPPAPTFVPTGAAYDRIRTDGR